MDETDIKPKWNRRKEARPTEILEAALHVFVEQGFATAKLNDVAKCAGIVKGTLYRYYETKEDLFRAVVEFATAAHLQAIEQAATTFQGSLAELVPVLLVRAAEGIGQSRIPALARLVISESRNFPDLARIWYDNVVAQILTLFTNLIADAQARGEVRPGDPQVHAFSIVGPMVMALLFNEVLDTANNHGPALNTLATQHAETVLRGLLVTPDEQP